MKRENKLILFTDDEGKVSINVCFADEDVWLTQEQLAQIYATTQQNVSQHVKCIYADGELSDEATHKKFLLVRQEGSRQVKREIDHYNLDYAEFQALEQNPMRMEDWITALDEQILRLRRNINQADSNKRSLPDFPPTRLSFLGSFTAEWWLSA